MYRNFWNGFHICDDDDGHKDKSTKLLSFHFFIAKAKKLFLMHFYDFGELYDQHVQNIHK